MCEPVLRFLFCVCVCESTVNKLDLNHLIDETNPGQQFFHAILIFNSECSDAVMV